MTNDKPKFQPNDPLLFYAMPTAVGLPNEHYEDPYPAPVYTIETVNRDTAWLSDGENKMAFPIGLLRKYLKMFDV